MKKYLLTAVLAALTASPALAASYHRVDRSEAAANSAYDYAMPGAGAVVSNGTFLGSDPDANVRTDLLREGNQSNISGN
jgi:opacity protein-like surface antigen